MPERYRAAVVLCYLEGLTCGAAARQLGWPVGTVKSRLSRGRERLLRRLIRRGIGPGDPSSPRQVRFVALPAALERDTLRAAVELAAGRCVDDMLSATAVRYSRTALRTVHITRAALIKGVVFAGLIAAAAAAFAMPRQEAARPTAKDGAPGRTVDTHKTEETLSVRVVDTSGRGVPNVAVDVQDRNKALELGRFRTGPGGWLRVKVDALFNQIVFEARPDAQTFGWAIIRAGELTPTGREDDPVKMVLLPCNHRVEGSIVDVRGKPIGGVTVHVVQLNHDVNRFASNYGQGSAAASVGSAVTDAAGRYTMSLPQETRVIFAAYHPKYVGPTFDCRPDDRTVKPVTLEDAGGIAGTVIDSITRQPVSGANVSAQLVEHHDRILGGGWGSVTSDASGRFAIGGLDSGVYNLLFESGRNEKTLVARAVEGVRSEGGRGRAADLVVIKGRRLRGTAMDMVTNKPMAGESIMCYSLSRPRSGAACQWTRADELGQFEFFVPPGPVFVYIGSGGMLGRSHKKSLIIPDDRDPDPVHLTRRYPPEGDSARPAWIGVECAVHVRVAAGDAGAGERMLSGRVFDSAGLAVPSVRVHYNANRQFVETATDRLGMFRLKGLPAGALEIGLAKWGYGHGSAEISPEASEVDIILPKNAGPDE